MEETEENGSQSTQLYEPRGRGVSSPPATDSSPGCGCGGCPPRPETPSSHSALDRTGKGGGGGTEPSAIFPYRPKHTDTLPGRRLRGEPSPAPPPAPRPPAQPGTQSVGSGKAPSLAGRPPPREEPRTRTPPSPSSPQRGPAVSPQKSASCRRGWLLTTRHRRLLFQNQGSR